MYKLRYLEQSKIDLLRIKRYIAKQSGSNELALRYTEKLRQQCRKISELPGTMGRARPEIMEGLRSFPYDNYVIFFRYSDSLIEIVSIIEGHRDIEALFLQEL
ncbi:plasmid stabilization system [Rivularia sp. IAM M-261]|nr:plasmid stabilization system [Rivularia sp. IAM M-261]